MRRQRGLDPLARELVQRLPNGPICVHICPPLWRGPADEDPPLTDQDCDTDVRNQPRHCGISIAESGRENANELIFIASGPRRRRPERPDPWPSSDRAHSLMAGRLGSLMKTNTTYKAW